MLPMSMHVKAHVQADELTCTVYLVCKALLLVSLLDVFEWSLFDTLNE